MLVRGGQRPASSVYPSVCLFTSCAHHKQLPLAASCYIRIVVWCKRVTSERSATFSDPAWLDCQRVKYREGSALDFGWIEMASEVVPSPPSPSWSRSRASRKPSRIHICAASHSPRPHLISINSLGHRVEVELYAKNAKIGTGTEEEQQEPKNKEQRNQENR